MQVISTELLVHKIYQCTEYFRILFLVRAYSLFLVQAGDDLTFTKASSCRIFCNIQLKMSKISIDRFE